MQRLLYKKRSEQVKHWQRVHNAIVRFGPVQSETDQGREEMRQLRHGANHALAQVQEQGGNQDQTQEQGGAGDRCPARSTGKDGMQCLLPLLVAPCRM